MSEPANALPPSMTVEIGELVLEGVEMAGGALSAARLRAAVERELARLIAERGLDPASPANLNVATIRVAPGAQPEAIGAQIASAVYGTLSRGNRRGAIANPPGAPGVPVRG